LDYFNAGHAIGFCIFLGQLNAFFIAVAHDDILLADAFCGVDADYPIAAAQVQQFVRRGQVDCLKHCQSAFVYAGGGEYGAGGFEGQGDIV